MPEIMKEDEKGTEIHETIGAERRKQMYETRSKEELDRLNQEYWEREYFYNRLNNIKSNIRMVSCEGCGKVFFTTSVNRKYCTYKPCAFIVGRRKRLAAQSNTVCVTCGKKFTPKRNDAKYCSNACRQKAYRQNVTDKVSDQNEHLPQS